MTYIDKDNATPPPEGKVASQREADGPGGWLIREADGGWLWTGRKIAATAALTEGHEVVSLPSLKPQGGRDTSDAVSLIAQAKAALVGHIQAIQVAKRDGGNSAALTDCINGLPEIVRWLREGVFEVEAAFEAYEDRLASPTEQASDVSGLVEDAERFRALMRCGRIKMQGSSGVDPRTGERNGNNVHFGAEFWPEPITPEWETTYREGTTWGRACIRALADAILEQEALSQAQQVKP